MHSSGNMTLSLNNIKARSNALQLHTYDQSGNCALIPHRSEGSTMKIPFMKPFSIGSKVLYLITIGAVLMVWRMFKVIKNSCLAKNFNLKIIFRTMEPLVVQSTY